MLRPPRRTVVVLILLLALTGPEPRAAAARATRTIAVTVDAEVPADLLERLRAEIAALTQQELDVEIPADRVLGAGGSIDGARAIHDRLLADADVDLIIALGPLVSAELVSRRDLSTPVIAPLVIDGWVIDAPRATDGGSGVPNLNYIAPVFEFADDVRRYRELVDFEEIAVVAPTGLAGLLRDRRGPVWTLTDIDLVVRPVALDQDAARVLDALPPSVDAVMVAGPTTDEVDAFAPLFRALAARGLPAFSTTGEIGVHAGALAGLTPGNWFERLIRRTALHARRILIGEAAADLPVQLLRQEALYVNMGTARALGVSPTFELMSDAQLVGSLTREPARTLDLRDVLAEAVAKNRDLQAARRQLDASLEDVGVARARLLPQIDALAGYRRIDEDRAALGTLGPESIATVGAELTQILWSEAAWSNVSVREHLADSARAALRQAELDVQLDAAQAYFDVLAALAVERIRRDNLRLTRDNLERARVRQRLGAASAAEEYRWESQVARDQDALVTSIAQRNLAEIELNRVLNLPLEEKLGVRGEDSSDAILDYLDPRFFPYVDDPVGLRKLRAYVATVAIENSPEIAQLDAAIEVQRRLLSSQTRSFFSPDVALTGELTRTLDRSGAGAADVEAAYDAADVDDLDWSLTLGVSLPLFEGGGRFAERSRLAVEILRLEREREALAERLEQRARSAVHVASASFTRIRLTARAVESAGKNFDLVADAYAQGAVSIIDLLDAQTAYFNAQQEAANSLFQLMADVMEVERASGDFVVLYDDAAKDDVFERLDAFMAPENPAQED